MAPGKQAAQVLFLLGVNRIVNIVEINLCNAQDRDSSREQQFGTQVSKRWVADDMDTLQPQATWGRTLREELPDETIFQV